MHFSTAAAEPGDQAFLESRWLYPKSGAQCLQFFLHNSGATDDVLNIWVREYDKANPSSSKLKLFKSISGRKRCLKFCASTVSLGRLVFVQAFLSQPFHARHREEQRDVPSLFSGFPCSYTKVENTKREILNVTF